MAHSVSASLLLAVTAMCWCEDCMFNHVATLIIEVFGAND